MKKKLIPKRKNMLLVGPIFLLFALAGCAPSLPDYIEDYDLVYTTYNKTYDFNTVTTYFMPDSVIHITTGGTSNRTYDQQVLQRVQTNLNNLGWTKKNPSAGSKADVLITIAASDQTTASCAYYCWYCYWGWYPGWPYYPYSFDPTWSWYYPTDIVCSSYRSGSILVTITDPDMANASAKQLPIEWLGITNGLLEGDNISERINTNIDQMFNQSPYLK